MCRNCHRPAPPIPVPTPPLPKPPVPTPSLPMLEPYIIPGVFVFFHHALGGDGGFSALAGSRTDVHSSSLLSHIRTSQSQQSTPRASNSAVNGNGRQEHRIILIIWLVEGAFYKWPVVGCCSGWGWEWE